MCCEVIWNLSIFLSNCTAPIYCNVIKNSYCECLSQFPFPLQEFQVTEHPTNSMCLAVILHSFLYFCWSCLSQSCHTCHPWCLCLWEGQLLRAGGNAEELSWCGKFFTSVWWQKLEHVPFITRYCILPSLSKFCPRILWGCCCFPPFPPPQASCDLRNACSTPGVKSSGGLHKQFQELALSEELLLCNQQPWKIILLAWRTPPVEQHFCFWSCKGSYQPRLRSGWKIAVSKPTSPVTL